MPVIALKKDYHGEFKDKHENFHGNTVVYIGWDHHLLFCAAKAFPLPIDMPFNALIENVMSDAFGQHPEFTKINWETVNWMLDGEAFQPDFSKTLKELGVGHKSLIRFETPELKGYANAGI